MVQVWGIWGLEVLLRQQPALKARRALVNSGGPLG